MGRAGIDGGANILEHAFSHLLIITIFSSYFMDGKAKAMVWQIHQLLRAMHECVF